MSQKNVKAAIKLLRQVLPKPPKMAVSWCRDYAEEGCSPRKAVTEAVIRAYEQGALSEPRADSAEKALQALLGNANGGV